MREIETLIYKHPIMLIRVWESLYAPFGWKAESSIEERWSWKELSYIYVLKAYREEGKIFTEIINNKSETNSHKVTWSAMNKIGDTYIREFWCNLNDPETHFRNERDHWKWICKIWK